MENPIDEKKPKKKKTVKEKVSEAIDGLQGQVKKASEGEAAELKEAIEELKDVLSQPELSDDQKRQIIGYNVITGEPVFMPGHH